MKMKILETVTDKTYFKIKVLARDTRDRRKLSLLLLVLMREI